MNNYYLNAMGICCCLGSDKKSIAHTLFGQSTTAQNLGGYLKPNNMILHSGETCFLGQVEYLPPELPTKFKKYNGRNNRLLLQILLQIKPEVDGLMERYGTERIAVVFGTSTSSIGDGEDALFYYKDNNQFPNDYYFTNQEICDGSEFIANYLGLENMAVTISTACSSSAKTFQHALEMMEADICDAVIVGGVDSLCYMTCEGFNSLGALADERCNPFSDNRKGISIGEGGALFIMSRDPAEVRLMSVGESSDGYSMTAPEPDGKGAEMAMKNALDKADLKAEQIAYVNLHGTSTPHNDSMESKAVSRIFGDDVACSSSKSIVGHTLGAAGATETALCWLMLSSTYNPNRKILPHLWDGEVDEGISLNNFTSVGDVISKDIKDLYVISNFCAFGGSNASVILKQNNADD